MSARTLHQAHDRLLADLKLLDLRIGAFADQLGRWSTEIGPEYTERLTTISRRVTGLLNRVDSWGDVEVGTLTEARHLSEDMDALESDFRASTQSHAPDYEVAMDQQVRAWKSRLDTLRLQGVLASMELRDELAGLSDRLEHARAGVLIELQNAVGDSGDLVVDVRNDLEEVLSDVRRGLENAYDAVFDRSERL